MDCCMLYSSMNSALIISRPKTAMVMNVEIAVLMVRIKAMHRSKGRSNR